MKPREKIWLTRAQAAKRARLGLRTIDRMMADGRLIRHRDALGRVRIEQSELDALITPRQFSPDLEPVPEIEASGARHREGQRAS
jgi:excisionase family DNA binding protein